MRLEAPALVELVKILLGLITAQDLVPPWIATKAANFLFSILKKNQTRLDGTLVIDHRPLVARVDLLLFGPRRLPPSLAEMYASCSPAPSSSDLALVIRRPCL